MRDWKAHLKGAWDGRGEGQSILVTGSARMEPFRQGGESLAPAVPGGSDSRGCGRVFPHRRDPRDALFCRDAARAGRLAVIVCFHRARS